MVPQAGRPLLRNCKSQPCFVFVRRIVACRQPPLLWRRLRDARPSSHDADLRRNAMQVPARPIEIAGNHDIFVATTREHPANPTIPRKVFDRRAFGDAQLRRGRRDRADRARRPAKIERKGAARGSPTTRPSTSPPPHASSAPRGHDAAVPRGAGRRHRRARRPGAGLRPRLQHRLRQRRLPRHPDHPRLRLSRHAGAVHLGVGRARGRLCLRQQQRDRRTGLARRHVAAVGGLRARGASTSSATRWAPG